MDRERAAAGAVGEAVERYACRVVPYGDLVWGSYHALGERAVDPTTLVLYDDERYGRADFPYRRFDPDEVLPWIGGSCLTRRQGAPTKFRRTPNSI